MVIATIGSILVTISSYNVQNSASCDGLSSITSSLCPTRRILTNDMTLARRHITSISIRKYKRTYLVITQASPVLDPIFSTSKNSNDSSKKSTEVALILIRHGESLWNKKKIFIGCVDVPLTQKGVEEAFDAGKRISNIPIDLISTSTLVQAQMTTMLAMTEHHRKKVPIIIHNESEQAKAWSMIFSEDTQTHSILVITSWQLNECMYGELQCLNKQEIVDRYGKEKVHEWHCSYEIPPPNGESLKMCIEPIVAYFKE